MYENNHAISKNIMLFFPSINLAFDVLGFYSNMNLSNEFFCHAVVVLCLALYFGETFHLTEFEFYYLHAVDEQAIHVDNGSFTWEDIRHPTLRR